MSRSTIAVPFAFLLCALPLVSAPALRAHDEPGAGVEAEAGSQSPMPVAEPEETASVSRHRAAIDGATFDYTATVGNYLLRDADGAAKGSLVYVAYTRDGVEDPASRPVTFAFNGGPGAASVWVHLGAFGPRKAELDTEGFPVGPPPGRLVDNPYSVLDRTDLVFIDPISTGYSRALPGEDPKQFHGYAKDVAAVGEFIRLWITRNERWASPKFLAGESYGTTRSAGLAGYLQDEHGMFLNGIALISTVLNFQTTRFNLGNDLPFILFLPTYTATAWFHGKLPARYETLASALADAEAFALGEYASALLRGADLEGEQRARIVARTAELTGLSERYVERTDLRVSIWRFTKELLREEGKVVGRLDSRYVNSDRDDAGESYDFDPSWTAIDGYYIALLNDYLRRELGYQNDLPFRSLAEEVWPWSYHADEENTNRYASTAETLRQAIHKNPRLEVLVMSGYYDLATPYFAADYTVDHLQLAEELRDRVQVVYYPAGHMMYVRDADHAKFRRDFLALIDRALAE